MTAFIAAPRYSADDFETASVRSAAPSYISDVPSYHSTLPYPEAIPAYTPAIRDVQAGRNFTSNQRQRTIGLPPIPPLPSRSIPDLRNFRRITTWSTTNAPAARQYRNVAERRITDGRHQPTSETPRRYGVNDRSVVEQLEAEHKDDFRPLEDPYLVGEEAAAQARRERLARETGEDILQREDKQWDWLLVQMKDWEEREKSWANFRREVNSGKRKKLMRRIGGHLTL